jgi:signal peptidase I
MTSQPTSAALDAAQPGRRQRFWAEARELGSLTLGGVVAAMLLHTVLFQPFTIPSSSMEPGLVTGDYIIVSKFTYGWSGASLPFNLHCSTAACSAGRREGVRWWCSACRATPDRSG